MNAVEIFAKNNEFRWKKAGFGAIITKR